jgi:hypothetical protein
VPCGWSGRKPRGVTSAETPTVGIRYTPLSELRRWPRNPKLHDLGQIADSIRRHGFVDPIVVDERSGLMVAGHGRDETLESMKRAGEPAPKRIIVREDGEWLVPVLTGIEFSDETTAEAYIIGSNRLVEMGGWDEALLQDIVTSDGFDALGTGLDLEMPDLSALGLGLDTSGMDPEPSAADLSQGGEDGAEKVKTVRVGKHKAPITEAEQRALVGRLESYEETHGTMAGFWSSLLGLL